MSESIRRYEANKQQHIQTIGRWLGSRAGAGGYENSSEGVSDALPSHPMTANTSKSGLAGMRECGAEVAEIVQILQIFG